MKYVAHICANPDCNNIWIDKDITNVKTYPPKWKYCEECCKSMGIDFSSQRPSDSYSDEVKKSIDKMRESRGKDD